MGEKNTNQNKRFGWLIIFTISSWIVVLSMLYFVNPEKVKNILVPGLYLPMTLGLFCSVFLTLSVLFLSAKRALVWSMGTMLAIILRVYGLGNLYNLVLLLALVVAWEFYRKESEVV